jgi:hypothetical protein
MLLRECAQRSWAVITKCRDFPIEFDEGGGLKNRRMERKKKCKRRSGDVTYTYSLR